MKDIRLGPVTRASLLLVFAFCAVIPSAPVALDKSPFVKQHEYIVATGYAGGTYYHAGLAIATQIDVRSVPPAKFGLVAVATAGSAENIKLLRANKVQLAVVQELAVEELLPREGAGSRDQSPVASIGWLWNNVEHFLLLDKFVEEGTLSDVASVSGQPVYLGAADSGTLLSTRLLLKAAGVPMPEESADVSSYDAAADALINGEIVFASLPGGDPVSSVSRVFSALGPSVRMLSVTDEQYEKIAETSLLWHPFTIPRDTYPLQGQPVLTLAQRNLLIVRRDLPEDDVYVITKEIYENVQRLSEVHPALSQLGEARKDVGDIWPPLHPGAKKYFDEAGILSPN